MKSFTWYLARSKNGFLCLFMNRPININGIWTDGTNSRLFFEDDKQPEITYDNSPVPITGNIELPMIPTDTLTLEF